MNTTTVLLRFPGYPFCPDALLPDRHVAEAAAVLRAAGGHPAVIDLGTPDLVTRLCPKEHRATVRRVLDRFLYPVDPGGAADIQVLWALRSTHRAFATLRREACSDIAHELIRRDAELVCVSVHTPDDVVAAATLADRVMNSRSRTRIVLIGEAAETWREHLLASCGGCSGVVWGPLSEVLPHLMTPGRLPALLPGMSTRNGAARPPRPTNRDAEARQSWANAWITPAYDPEFYPALADSTAKLRVFEINAAPVSGAAPTEQETGPPSVARLCDLMAMVMDRVGSRAFHFRAAGISEHRATALLLGLMHRQLDPVFSCSGHVADTSPQAMALLKDAGCEAIRLRVETGSQRLLEDYYGRRTTVTHVESVLRAAAEAGLFTLTDFCYPAPPDDQHTHAENLRLAARTRPHGAVVCQPVVTPNSAWNADPLRFGFALGGSRLPAPTRFPLPLGRWQLAPQRQVGRSCSEAVYAQEKLIADLTRSGVSTTATERLALMARVLGSGAYTTGFATRVVHMLYTGDAESLRSLVRQFNDAARAVPAPATRAQTSPSRRAVGD